MSKQIQATIAVALLLLCLMGTHWVGFAHSISHAGLHSPSIDQCVATDSVQNLSHSSDTCHLFDALTLAGFVPGDALIVIDSIHYATRVAGSIDLILYEPKLASYQSRAPPTFIL